MSDSVWITGQTVYGQQAIVALEHVVSVVELPADTAADTDKAEGTITIRLRDQTHLELAMDIDTFWNLIPGVTTRARSNPGKRT